MNLSHVEPRIQWIYFPTPDIAVYFFASIASICNCRHSQRKDPHNPPSVHVQMYPPPFAHVQMYPRAPLSVLWSVLLASLAAVVGAAALATVPTFGKRLSVLGFISVIRVIYTPAFSSLDIPPVQLAENVAVNAVFENPLVCTNASFIAYRVSVALLFSVLGTSSPTNVAIFITLIVSEMLNSPPSWLRYSKRELAVA